jgi:hypothetical protein
LPELLTQAEVEALHPGTEVMVLEPRLDPRPRKCIIRKRRIHKRTATYADTLFDSEDRPWGMELLYSHLQGVGKGPHDIHVWLVSSGGPSPKKKGE